MGRRRIDAREALDAIRSGMDDQALMVRFRLSAKGLQSLFRKLAGAGAIAQTELDGRVPSFLGQAFIADAPPSGNWQLSSSPDCEGTGMTGDRAPSTSDGRGTASNPPAPSQQKAHASSKRPPLDARKVLEDIRSGMADGALMHKYQLSAKGLQYLFDQLIDAGLLGLSELDERMLAFDATVDVMEMIKQIGEPTPSLGPENRVEKSCPACGEPQTILFEECPACGVNIERFRRREQQDRRVADARWKCPACGRPWTQQHDECPVCGVIVSKFKDNE